MISRTGTRRIAVLTMVAMAFAMTAGSGVALAVNNHFTGNGDGTSWTDGANWELGNSPTVAGSNALANAAHNVVIDGTAEVVENINWSGGGSVTISNGGSLIATMTAATFGIGVTTAGDGTLTVDSSASSSTFIKGGSFTLGNSAAAGAAVANGYLNIGAGTFEGSHMNIGHFTGDTRGSGYVNLSGSGTLSAISEFNVGRSAAHGQDSYVNFDGGGTIKVPLGGMEGNVEGKIAGGVAILANGSAGTLGVDILKTTDGTHAFYNLANPIPEPTSLALLAMGLGGIGVLVRRRR